MRDEVFGLNTTCLGACLEGFHSAVDNLEHLLDVGHDSLRSVMKEITENVTVRVNVTHSCNRGVGHIKGYGMRIFFDHERIIINNTALFTAMPCVSKMLLDLISFSVELMVELSN
jgi:hypothetical protein